MTKFKDQGEAQTITPTDVGAITIGELSGVARAVPAVNAPQERMGTAWSAKVAPPPAPSKDQDISDGGLRALAAIAARAAKLTGAYDEAVLELAGSGSVGEMSAEEIAFWADALAFAAVRLRNESTRRMNDAV